jgi:ribosomal protein S27E
MPIRITCPGCKKPLLVPDQLAGKKVRCKGCAAAIAVPGNAPPTGTMPVSRPPVAKGAGAPPVKPGQPAGKPPTKPGAKPVLRSKPADLEAMAAESLGLEEKPGPNGSANGNGHANGNGTNGAAAAAAPKPPIKFNCTFCDEEVTLAADQAGKQVPCPSCTRIVRVPVPKETKPKDWRTVEKKGPSAAVSSQPEKLENAWGTENNAKVSQKALIEAGVVAKAPKKKVRLDDRIARWVKGGLLAAVAVGIGAWLYQLSRIPTENAAFVEIEKKYKKYELDAKWPPILRAEFRRLVGERRLKTLEAAEPATLQFMLARDAASQPGDGKQKLDCEFFLIELARDQIELGGNEAAIIAKNRIDWERAVPTELKATLGRIEHPEARLLALRILKQPLLDRKQTDVFKFLDDDFNKGGGKQLASQIEAAEKVRRGKLDEVLKPARDTKVDPGRRLDLVVSVATFLREEMPDQCGDCDKALEVASEIASRPDYRDRLRPWTLLQLVRLVVRTPDGAGKAAELVKQFHEGKDKPYERRAKFEIKLAQLEKAPPFDDATAIIAEIEPDGQGIAWLTWARATARAKGELHLPEADEKHFDFLIETAKPILVPEATK